VPSLIRSPAPVSLSSGGARLPLPLPDLRERSTKRALICGPSGEGKSRLAREILLGLQGVYSSTVIMDPKGEFQFPGAKVYDRYRDLCYRDPPSAVRVRIYRPGPRELGSLEAADHIFWWCWVRGRNATQRHGFAPRVLLYLDETLWYVRYGMAPRGLLACITTGRGFGVGVICATQRPSGIPVAIRSESEHTYIFRLRTRADRKRVEEDTGLDEEMQLALPPHAFYHAYGRHVHGPMKLRIE
jgi:hypothetical protein